MPISSGSDGWYYSYGVPPRPDPEPEEEPSSRYSRYVSESKRDRPLTASPAKRKGISPYREKNFVVNPPPKTWRKENEPPPRDESRRKKAQLKKKDQPPREESPKKTKKRETLKSEDPPPKEKSPKKRTPRKPERQRSKERHRPPKEEPPVKESPRPRNRQKPRKKYKQKESSQSRKQSAKTQRKLRVRTVPIIVQTGDEDRNTRFLSPVLEGKEESKDELAFSDKYSNDESEIGESQDEQDPSQSEESDRRQQYEEESNQEAEEQDDIKKGDQELEMEKETDMKDEPRNDEALEKDKQKTQEVNKQENSQKEQSKKERKSKSKDDGKSKEGTRNVQNATGVTARVVAHKSPEKKTQSKDKKVDNDVRRQRKGLQKEKPPLKIEQKNGHGVFLNEIRNERRNGPSVTAEMPSTPEYTNEEDDEWKGEDWRANERESDKEKKERKTEDEERLKKNEVKQNGCGTPKKEYKGHTVVPIVDDSGKEEVSYSALSRKAKSSPHNSIGIGVAHIMDLTKAFCFLNLKYLLRDWFIH